MAASASATLIRPQLTAIMSSLLLILTFGTANLCLAASSKLILTPYLAAGRISEAQALSRVNATALGLSADGDSDGAFDVISHSGFFTVNETTNSNLFFWFFPGAPQIDEEKANAPLILWLQGGPGTSSMFGLFVENGPFAVDESLKLSLRAASWTRHHSMIYIDSPVETGYSFTDSNDGYAKTLDDVTKDLYKALEQFFVLFPKYQKRDFYVAGESYAGKYVPALGHKIHKEQQAACQREGERQPNSNSGCVQMILKGLMIGAGFSDPESMIDSYGEYLQGVGLIGEADRKRLDEKTAISKQLIREGNFSKAAELQDELIGGETLPYPTFFKNATGYDFYYNVLHARLPADHSHYIKFIQQEHVRAAIHVGVGANATIFHNQSLVVPEKLLDDIFRSVKPTMEELLNLQTQTNAVRVLLYVGQFDIVVPHLAVYKFIKSLEGWSGREKFLSAKRRIWYTNRTSGTIGGYIQAGGSLKFAVLRGAGHNAPYDQPEACLKLISSFTSGQI